MGLVAQWRQIETGLPADWEQAQVRLAVVDEHRLERAAALLGPLTPGRSGRELRFTVSRRATPSQQAVRRLLAKLDEEGIRGALELLGVASGAEAAPGHRRPSLAASWDRVAAELPEDWSDLLCRLELTSSDDLPRAALLTAPLNPSRPDPSLGFDFRVARRFGYGASPQMARRCLARLDEEGIPGEVRVLRALSDTEPAGTQGPVWYVGGKVL